MITDEMLRIAAAKSCEMYVEWCIDSCDNDMQHIFSLQFERKIKKLKRKADHPLFYHAMHRVASILLALLIGASAWLVVDTEARAAVLGWIKDIYENFIIYQFDEKAEESVPANDYRPAWIPDGYTEFFVDMSTENKSVIYANETGEMLKFSYVHNPSETFWAIDLSHLEKSTTKVGEFPADLFISSSSDVASCILWSLPNNTQFFVSAFLDEDNLVRVAESVQIVE